MSYTRHLYGFIKRKITSKLSLNILYSIYFEDGIITCLIDYIIIFIMFLMIGYPIGNADLPPIINTFLENNDLNGKYKK